MQREDPQFIDDHLRTDLPQHITRRVNTGEAQTEPTQLRVFIDTEFSNLVDLDLISIAAVSEDGDEFYAEKADYPLKACNEFVRTEVLPKLGAAPDRVLSTARLREELRAWLESLHRRSGGRVMVCYDYFGDFALLREVLSCEIPGWMTYDNVDRKVPRELRKAYWQTHPEAVQHHALHDARALCWAFQHAARAGVYGTAW